MDNIEIMEENKQKREVPKPKDPNSLIDQFQAYYDIVKILRQDCPWDRAQTNESIAPLILEEAHEMIDAVHKKDDPEFCKELGDLLLHLVMHGIMAEERGAFSFKDIIAGNAKKMVHRHPHVFGDVNVENQEEVLVNWEALKKQEGRKSVLDGVPKNMPSLLRAERIQQKAARVGFDWDSSDLVWDKVYEELGELKVEIEKGDKKKSEEEFGDFIFALVNLARHKDIISEDALMRTNEKFTRRFQFIEKAAEESGRELKKMTLEEMDELWNKAKIEEKK
jgi:XTP/dITP diphosphohydrolase